MGESRRSAAYIIIEIVVVILAFGIASGADPQQVQIPVFEKSTQTFSPMVTFHTALADLDADGDLDAVFANMGYPSQVLRNNGSGQFGSTGQSFPYGMHGVACGDVDGDDDIDVFFAANTLDYGSSPLYLNTGNGLFQLSAVDIGDAELNGLAIQMYDVENDGDLDATIEYTRNPRLVYLNDGSGNFANSGLSLPERSSLHDLNSDGYVDLLAREPGNGFRVYLNDQTGGFVSHSFYSKPDLTAGRQGFADIDGDGDQDVIYTNGEGIAYPAGVLLNDGSGNLSAGQQLGAVNLGRIGLGDLNNDGHIDIVFTDWDNPSQIWLNDGEGSLFDSGVRLAGDGWWTDIQIGDVDNDGDQDIFIANVGDGGNTLWFNVTPDSSCCGRHTSGMTGNVNCSDDGKLTLSDISILIDRVYISKATLCCEAEGNTNGSSDCAITLSDITALIDAVYISKAPPEACLPACEVTDYGTISNTTAT